MKQLDSDLLRTFLAIAEAGSMTSGAQRINRSQSAISLQIKQLEGIVGHPVFRRHGRGVTLTATGERLLPAARRVTATLDATLAEIRNDALSGKLRIGLPEDHGRTALSGIVANFAAAHPRVELEVHCALGTGFGPALAGGALDLAIHEIPAPSPDAEVLRTDTLAWMAARDHDAAMREPLPVAVFSRDCWWRDAALSSLDAADRQYQVVFTSESTAGVRAAIASGIAVGLLAKGAASDDLVRMPGMRDGPTSFLVLQRAPSLRGPVCDAICDAIRRSFRI